MKLPMYESPDVCGSCGGECCKNLPGSFWPSDFEGDYRAKLNQILELLKSGRVCLDHHYLKDDLGGETIYFPRPVVVGQENHLYDDSFRGTCINLTNKGCSMNSSERPYECRMVKPNPDPVNRKKSGCELVYGGRNKTAEQWLPYQRLLKEAADIVRNSQ